MSKNSDRADGALDLSGWLGLAASPTFATMALWSMAFGDGQSAMICTAGRNGPIGGMTLMYLLMAAFHLPSWLRLVTRRRLARPAGGGM
ncbi:hypothetical protein [Caulobacter sp. 1776]|uniref:hypothetical protein n=1 Tax=Caulobacter sp. 1776 TaxID=3156420 RepID=UPI0033975259